MTNRRQTKRGTGSDCANAVVEVLESRRLLTAELLKDVNDVGGGALESGYEMVEYQNLLYFFSTDDAHGTELWRSDGTPGGTVMVKDVRPGPDGITPLDVHVANGLLWFVEGAEDKLWRSDGTETGTFPVAGATLPGTQSLRLGTVGDAVLFVNADGNELWKSDGTVAGTQRVRAFGAASPNQPLLGGFAEVGGDAFFWAKEGTQYRLWRTDGTEPGTRVADAASTFTSAPAELTAAGNRLFFIASFGDLWVHDPASGQSTLLEDETNFARELTAAGGVLYFTGLTFDDGTALWRSDGTSNGTRLVKPLAAGLTSFDPAHSTPFDGRLYFAAHDESGSYALWSTNPANPADTRLDVSFGVAVGRAIPRAVEAIGERLYIGVENDVAGDSLWVSDGTQVGTTKLNQMPPDGLVTPSLSLTNTYPLVGAGGRVFFAGQDGVSGQELWTTDGSAAGTSLVRDIRGGTATAQPIRLFEANGLRYFFARHGALGSGLWRTDGTSSGTVFLVKTSDSEIAHLGTIGGAVFFRATTAEHGTELWQTDGTPAGTRLVKDVVPGFASSGIERGAVLDGMLYFENRPGVFSQLWKSDGTEAGTVSVMDINGQLFDLASDGERLLLAYNGALHQSDGTAAGTTTLAGGGFGSNSLDARQLTPTDKGTFFTGRNSAGTLIWLTDGTPGGTRAIGSGYTDAVILEYVNGILYFAASDGVHGQELWRTDGTDAGTYMLADAKAGSAGQFFNDRSPKPWMKYGELLLVQLTNANNERQLWRSDGTVNGTYLLPLPGVTRMRHFDPPMAVVGGLAYVGDLGDLADPRGRMWSTDGTIDGTKIVSWEPLDDELSNPSDFMSVNGELVFAASDPVIGRELYTLDVPEVITITGTDGDDRWEIADAGVDRVGVWVGGRSGDEAPDYEFAVADVTSLRFVGLGGNDQVMLFSGASVPIEFDGGDGTDRIVTTGGGTRGSGTWETLDVFHSGFTFHADSSVQSVNVGSGGSVTLAPGGGVTLRTGAVTLGEQDDLDVNDNTLVVEGGDVAAIEALVARGRNGGEIRWSGSGIRSTAAANNPLRGLAVGQVGDDVIVKYTYNGDANLDGRIDADDYFRIDQAFLAQPAAPRHEQGDFNYDDAIDADDYFLIDQAFLGQSAPATTGGGAVGARVVVDDIVEREGRKRAKVRPVVETVTARARGAMRRSASTGVRRG